jgi:hypothetical protein
MSIQNPQKHSVFINHYSVDDSLVISGIQVAGLSNIDAAVAAATAALRGPSGSIVASRESECNLII